MKRILHHGVTAQHPATGWPGWRALPVIARMPTSTEGWIVQPASDSHANLGSPLPVSAEKVRHVRCTSVPQGRGWTVPALNRLCNAPRCTLLFGMRFAHKGLRRFYAHGDAKGLNAAHVARIRRLLSTLQDASSPQDMALPGYRLHRLTGDRHGQWSVRVSGNWRIVFRFVEGVAVDVDLIDYH